MSLSEHPIKAPTTVSDDRSILARFYEGVGRRWGSQQAAVDDYVGDAAERADEIETAAAKSDQVSVLGGSSERDLEQLYATVRAAGGAIFTDFDDTTPSRTA